MANELDIYKQLLKAFEAESKKNTALDKLKEVSEQLSILNRAFLLPLRVLRTAGNNPLFFTRNTDKATKVTFVKFEYKPYSWLTHISFIYNLSYIAGFSFLAWRLFSGQYNATRIPGSEE